MLDEVLALAPALEANWPAERAAFSPDTLLNDGTEAGEGGEGGEGGESEGAPGEGQAAEGGEEESFIEFDPSQIPEGTDPLKWVGEQYGEMRKAFTQKTMGISETRREAEQSQALIEGLQDPTTMPHYLRLLGVDLSKPETLEQLGISAPAAVDEDEELRRLLEDDDENNVETRLEQIERERAEEKQAREHSDMEQALDNLADQELEGIEKAWGRELDDDEDAFIRHRAEASPGADGLPDYESAAKVLKGFLNRRVQEELKRRSEPGRGAPGGKPGGKALDPTKDEDRLALGAAAAERAMASQEQ
jgi:hypothetical protein